MGLIAAVAHRAALLLVFVAAMACTGDGLHAQGSDNGGEQSEPALQDLTPEQLLLLYLSNEKVVVAGVGFINAQVGDLLSSVLNIWGEPVSQDLSLLGKSDYVYQPMPHLTVTFTGKDTLRTITCEGTSAAPFRTRRGARFGMSLREVTSLYPDARAKTKSDQVEYESLGITFLFSDDRLEKVVVYGAKS